MKIKIENLKAQMQGFNLNIYQKADALIEFNKLLDYVSELEQGINDLIVVELSDEEIKIITRQELEQWQQSAKEFDGFEGWIVRGKLIKNI